MRSQSPLVNRITLMVGAIVLMALASMTTTLVVTNSIGGDASALNTAGSLRMGAYRLLLIRSLEDQPGYTGQTLEEASDHYQERLLGFGRLRAIPENPGHPVRQQYQAILSSWQELLRPSLKPYEHGQPVSHELRNATIDFARQVDEMVTALEHRTEARIQLIFLIQITGLVMSVIMVIALFSDLRNRVLKPLRQLVGIASAIGRQDFSQRMNPEGHDELAQLGKAFDQMTGQLARSYSELENEALLKTRELQKSHAALQILHSASRTLFANHDLCSGAIPMLQELEKLLGVGPIRLFLHDRNFNQPVETLVTATPTRPFHCKDHSCDACLVTPEAYDILPLEGNDGRRLLLPIHTSNQLLGTLEVWYSEEEGLSETARRLLETLSDQLATAIFLEKQITEEQQLTLAEERAVIARELHDSLAQSLSYLKIQVARLRRVAVEGRQQDLHGQILEELSTGLNSAYRQLRELLTTFRLKLDTPDLASALRQTVAEFSERLGHPVQLNYQLPPQTLSPNEEIHTLQIIREALANAVKHADASDVRVEVEFRSPQVQIRIMDNGKGLPDATQPPAHYGLIIMHDRTRTLGGKIQVQNREEGGVEVILAFVPKSRHLIPSEMVQNG